MAIKEVIKYEGDNTTFVWKHPKEDFNTNSQLIVHETQQAVFMRDGREDIIVESLIRLQDTNNRQYSLPTLKNSGS